MAARAWRASGAPFSARPAPLSFLLQKKAAKKMRWKDWAFRPLRRAAQGSSLRTRRLLEKGGRKRFFMASETVFTERG
ncbi:hypothetical protein H8R05_04525 [Anaerotruncus massiliensis]|uniref:Uncharacterized protein n=1 Tax=Anaerotruncus massiliensis (ex Togo et al. 2019) TaxID=1673720 RepID=A0ABR7ACP0_9FIRM|nr:hypothetical protein [Anaerotruncus massiliensis (ex Togo et al. 2019)]